MVRLWRQSRDGSVTRVVLGMCLVLGLVAGAFGIGRAAGKASVLTASKADVSYTVIMRIERMTVVAGQKGVKARMTAEVVSPAIINLGGRPVQSQSAALSGLFGSWKSLGYESHPPLVSALLPIRGGLQSSTFVFRIASLSVSGARVVFVGVRPAKSSSTWNAMSRLLKGGSLLVPLVIPGVSSECSLGQFGKCGLLSLRQASFAGVDLHGIDLQGANLAGSNFRGADLSGADLSGADLRGANLSSADLTGATLFSADLMGGDLRSAFLVGADLKYADLNSADLTSANLGGAVVDGMGIHGTVLCDTTMQNWYVNSQNCK